MTTDRPFVLAITTGEPAGVGPELTVQALVKCLAPATTGGIGAAAALPEVDASLRPLSRCRFAVIGDASLLASRAQAVGLGDAWQALLAGDRVRVVHHPLAVAAQAGQLDAANGRYVLALLDDAIDGALAGTYDAIVTAPLQKSTINDCGVAFTGHTEYLAERTGTPRVVMMLAGGGLRVALATTHLPLAQVPGAIRRGDLLETLVILNADLMRHFGVARPRILVTGLNPHAGESGYLGREEIDVITPALDDARAAGIDARGPYPADTLFQPRHLEGADAVLAMYHDQGLPVLKYASFGAGVNITLGLPIIRTSVDHGTALDLAGTGRAESGSLLEALRTAAAMAGNAAAHATLIAGVAGAPGASQPRS
ncbi:4-hydroxythreonine-4-phosphate dehydrogenase PdxA [Pandoraea pnomenusa]|uniref:4-hydroxythreonine-4-phosphate dehydrogenase n=1 Tax=Pandoraea pnomenusa TaxID=93220 RepID=A0ABY6WM86_9BURK|nr:4-hydroxythreonine-4-phosphate dehydrogenase PdxA [Pandoraea pnomenusa]AHB04384.1 4-hydroxythreonine-4-phosphate dehydrogenase [Pandoraea pnomenusa 3kgm]AHN76401.1 4-hydroxythreonine-4-phosphate dehydrogenase [Pandoraea pnomenusa]VVE69529.1 4-hydroxythreonine-4-phosphate dehydrogenase [Pandoraea pnomenusa]